MRHLGTHALQRLQTGSAGLGACARVPGSHVIETRSDEHTSLVARPARLLLRTLFDTKTSVQQKALSLALVAGLALPALAVPTPPGTNIDNTAEVAIVIGVTPITLPSNTVRVTTVDPDNTSLAEISFFQYAPMAPTPTLQTAGPTRCDTGGGVFSLLPNPVALDGTVIDPLSAVPMLEGDVFHRDEPLFVQVEDADHNLDSGAIESVLVTLNVSGTGDTEVLELTETGPATGVFVGYIMTGPPPTNDNDCLLEVNHGDEIDATYVDFEAITVAAAALVDPFGVLFDSSTGAPVDGATVTLINTATGLPAVVFGDDGVASYPATVTSGGTATDGIGTVYTFPPGGFRFPFVAPGNYRLAVVLPPGYLHPSVVPDGSLPPGFAIEIGSRGEVFVVLPGPALHIDIPLDPITGDLVVRKSTSSNEVAIGDFVQWRVEVQNAQAFPAPTATLTDVLPAGLRYRAGSARLDGAPLADPTISPDGQTLTFALGTIPATTTFAVSYVTAVGAGVRGRTLSNTAQAAAAGGVSSNVAQATVILKEDLFGDRSTLIGEVLEDSCEFATNQGVGVPGVRILLEDGSYAITDEKGRYHFKGVSEGTHVVQLDLPSLPEGYEVVACEQNTRFAGRPFSQFVDLQRGALWRADFRVRRPDPSKAVVRVQLRATSMADVANEALYEFDFSGTGAVPLTNLRVSFVVPDGASLVANSAVLDGTALPEAVAKDGVMTLRLGDRPAAFNQKIAFRLALPAETKDHTVRGVLTFDAAGKKNLRLKPVEVQLAPVAAGFDLESGRVLFTPHFPSRSWVLTEEDRAALRAMAAKVENLTNLRVHIAGFTDARRVRDEDFDDLKDNADLSQRRANAVADFLAAELKIDRKRITTEGRGAAEPIGDNQRKDGQQLNRRVIISAVGVAKTPGEGVKSESPIEELEVMGLRPGAKAGALPATALANSKAAPSVADYKTNYAPYARTVDGTLLASLEPGHALLWPAADVSPAIPSIKIAVQHRKGEKVELSVNGVPVPGTNVGGVDSSPDRDIVVRQWQGVDIKEGPNQVVAIVRDAAGIPVATLERMVHFSGPAVRAEFVASRSALIADGRSRPVVAVRLFDRWGRTVRPGSSGDFDVGAPFEPWREIDDRNKDKLFTVGDVRSAWIAGADGVALIELRPTTDTGQVQVRFKFAEKLTQDVFGWIEPAPRDWVLVGLAEGTLGHNTVKDNAAAFTTAGGMPDYYEDGRIAFYAKGMVKGDTLLTIAYDTSKDRQTGGATLEQQIDPNSYYLLYGDATEQGNDAASIRNLYLRVERQQFYAMFGDFDTGLTVTELGRYSRRMNGIKSEYRGDSWQYAAFASEDTTAFRKHEMQGDGTSGLYRLAQSPVVINSEQVRIQVRDRFHSEQIISEVSLTRYTDYTIDYNGGTLFFRRPVPSRDESFNPIFIVVDYETQSTGEGTFTGGGRGAVLLAGGKVEIGATAIHEGTTGADGDLMAADLKIKLGTATQLKAEVGASDTGVGVTQQDGTAFKVEVEHLGEVVAGRVYAREQDAAYGIGQQSGGEAGTRKIGAEGRIKVNEAVDVNAQAYVQDNLSTGSQRQVVEAEVRYSTDDSKYSATGGVRHAAESGLAANDLVSDQVYAGGTAQVTDKIALRAQGEFAVSGDSAATDFPDRLTVGADYKMTDKATAFLEHEIAQSGAQESDMTRVGVRTQPWERGRADAAVEQQYSEYGPRLFATVGLGQGWQASEDLLLDFGIDRVQTLRTPGNPDFDLDVPPASGSDLNGDFTAVYVGATYRQNDWTMNGRVESFAGDLEDRWGVSAGAYREQGERWGVSFRVNYMDSVAITGATSTDAALSLGLVYRPTNPEFIWLDRVDLIYDDSFDPLSGTARTYKLINNLNLNHRPVARWQTSYQYAFKWVRADFGDEYTAFTDLFGIDTRYDLTPEWDIGAQLYGLHSWDSGTLDYAAGVGIGHSFAKNVWLSVGYNFAGFLDEDFSGARYTAQGPYLQFRVKFDQDSYKELKSLAAPAASLAPTPTPAPGR